MQQLALQATASQAYPSKMTALQRDARDPNHAHGGGSFASLLGSSKPSTHIQPLAPSSSATPLSSLNNHASASDFSTNALIDSAISIGAGALMGGPTGALTAAASEVLEALSGDSVLGYLADLFTDTPPQNTTLTQANRAYLGADGLR